MRLHPQAISVTTATINRAQVESILNFLYFGLMMKYPFCLHGNPQMQAEARRLRTPIRRAHFNMKFDRLIITSVLFLSGSLLIIFISP